MEKDNRLEALCKEFPTLEEGEKDYLMEVAHALSFVTLIRQKQPDMRPESGHDYGRHEACE